MKQFYNDFTFIIGFMVLTLIVEMSMGEKAEWYWLLLVLISMVLVNVDDLTSWVDDTFSLKN